MFPSWLLRFSPVVLTGLAAACFDGWVDPTSGLYLADLPEEWEPAITLKLEFSTLPRGMLGSMIIFRVFSVSRLRRKDL